MSFLSKLSSIRKSIPAQPKPNAKPSTQQELYKAPALLPKNYTRAEDPAVRRLKERRQQELLRKGELSKKASSSKKSSTSKPRTKKNVDEENRTETRFKKRVSGSGSFNSSSRPVAALPQKRPEPLKKMSFEELMKQAENNAQTNEGKSSSASPRKNTPDPQSQSRRHVSKPGFKSTDRRRRAASQEPVRPIPKPQQQQPRTKESRPIKLAQPRNNFAKPNELLRKKLESKRQAARSRHQREDEYESDMDDFIEDDEADAMALERDPGYDRDEIWALFNRGKRRSDYAFDDDEEDDMEANEMEIIEEEERARKMAKLEDKREEEWLKRHEVEKKRRKKARE